MAAALAHSLCKAQIAGARTRIAARRVPAPAQARRHVFCFGSKVAEAELENSSKLEKKRKEEEEEEEEEFEGSAEDGLSPQQVESLLTVLCEETEIADVDLKIGGFKLHVRRSLKGGAAAAAAPSLSSVDEEDVEESMFTINSSKVGILRRCRYVKGKQVGKAALVTAGDKVKKGQVVAFVEQMGTHWPVESPEAGEVLEFLLEDGDPVEYGEPVAEIAPYFGIQATGYRA